MSARRHSLEQIAGIAESERSGLGHLVCLVGAHGGAGTTCAAIAVARGAAPDACLIDADLSGGTTRATLGLSPRPADAGLAAVAAVDGGILSGGGRRTDFGWHYDVGPRPELAWLIRDGAVRDLVRAAMRRWPFVVVDAARPTGPSFEPVLDADVVVLIGHANRPEALRQARQRLARSGVDERRIIECATAPGIVERAVGKVRRDITVIDVERDDRLMLLIEGRLAALGSRDRA